MLSCIANLSSDEVFTPPHLANQILDLLPEELWSDKKATFLDPGCKSGVFLREIAKRLDKGLEKQILDRQERLNHIFKNQLFGLAITELTALIARRSLYCSKKADGKYSVCEAFEMPDGNIHFGRIEHFWEDGRCLYCGASKDNYERGSELESHAYVFIHTVKPEEIFNMKFDVIIGNPPYQLSDKGGEGYSTIPLYHHFIEQAIKLCPRYISMIVPARWFSGGKGLDNFRDRMLHDKRLSVIHDFPETADCFPGLNIRGGVCYFLWASDHTGECTVYNHMGSSCDSVNRPLLEPGLSTFIRHNKAISIVRKVRAQMEPTMDEIVRSRNQFGIPSNYVSYSKKPTASRSVNLYRGDRSSRDISDRIGYISSSDVVKNKDLIQCIKVIVSKASPGGDEYPHAVLTRPIIADKNSACTETYLVVAVLQTITEARNMVSYMSTRFFRFMVALIKNTQNISKGCFRLVPQNSVDTFWTDEKLYKKYGLTQLEIDFIETMVRPMEASDE